MQATELDLYILLQKMNLSAEDAQKFIILLGEYNAEVVGAANKTLITENKESRLGNRFEDVGIELLYRLDSHFKWLIAIIIALFMFTVAVIKL